MLCAALALFTPPVAADVNLAARYKATLDYSEEAGGQGWTSEKQDVWTLRSFRFVFKNNFAIELGPSSVVFGKQGTSVLWAAVLPDAPGRIVKAPEGAGDQVTSLFLRFHPSLVGQLFPAKTVAESGPAIKLIWARHCYQHKINASWQWDNLPVVPWKQAIVLDCETTEKNRRFYSVDTAKGTVEYEPAFEDQPVPDIDSPRTTKEETLAIFDGVWKAFDAEYAMFGVKRGVDWNALRTHYRPIAETAQTYYEAASVVNLLLARLEDLHVHVAVGEQLLWGFSRFRPMNASWKATQRIVGNVVEAGKDLAWGQTGEGIGYINVWKLEDPRLPEIFDQALERLKGTRGLILDLRFNGGGDENLARSLAGRFVDQPRVYSVNQYRNGARHDNLGPKLERKVEPRGPWRYQGPVVALCGQKTMSSAESFVLMLAQCPQVMTVGDRTAGSSGNPRRLTLPGEIRVNLPRWLDMDPNGMPIDSVGIRPDIPIKAKLKDFSGDRDPVMDAAIEILRRSGKKKPDKQ